MWQTATWSAAWCLLSAVGPSSTRRRERARRTDRRCLPRDLRCRDESVSVIQDWLTVYAEILESNSAIPGGADMAMTAAARLRMYFTLTALLGGFSAGLVMVYRTLLRPGGTFPGWTTYWANWLIGRRELWCIIFQLDLICQHSVRVRSGSSLDPDLRSVLVAIDAVASARVGLLNSFILCETRVPL